MAVSILEGAFTAGEVTPALFGRYDLARIHVAATTMRNMFVRYQGGASSRAGTQFDGFSKQTGRGIPPRILTFQFAINQGLLLEFGNHYMRVVMDGGFVLEAAKPIAAISQANPGVVTTVAPHGFANGDWVVIDNAIGMSELNTRTCVVSAVAPTTFALTDVYGDPIDTSLYGPYLGGGTVARIYTLVTPWADIDLPFLKQTQSKDVMSLCLVNQESLVEYPTYDLARITNSNWTLTQVNGATPIAAPATCTIVASAAGTTSYQYVVTAVDPATGSESVASPIGGAAGCVDIASTAGTITITWAPVPGVNQYFVYKATPGYAGAAIPAGTAFGFAGFAYGTQFTDSNIVADFTQVPPQHRDPLAPGQIVAAAPVVAGAGYTTVGFTINTTTGSGAVLTGVLVGGALSAIIVANPGKNYAAIDTVTVTGDGANATAKLTIGPQSGTYPGIVSYFQQRRVYGYTLNRPDTYFLTQPGAYTNFDVRTPTIASDAITGNPFAIQVNGIQAYVNMPGGLIVFTGRDAYQLTGTGGSSVNPQPITPSTQQVTPQASNGCHFHILPLKIDQDILFVQTKGSIIRNISFQYLQNIYTGADITLTSSHLFFAHQLVDWAWAEEPFKVVWVVRDDGVLLALTFVKPQEIAGWARCDTNGLFVGVATVTELSDDRVYVDSVYFATERFPNGRSTYMIERMDDRIWDSAEDVWAVDCALRLPMPAPSAQLTASSATGLGAISGFTGLIGGQDYSAGAVGTIVDDNGQGPGTGATVALTIVGGAVTAVTVVTPGSGYVYPRLDISDPAFTGAGASAVATLDNSATFTASGNVFAVGNVGSVLRSGGGIATITAYVSPTQVTAQITQPIALVLADDENTPIPVDSGFWTMTQPVSEATHLTHLAGLTVTGLYDGKVLPPVVVPASGVVQLPEPATAITIGLPFEAQLQTPYVDMPGPTVQGQRKKIGEVTVRLEASRGVEAGSNQVDGSTLTPIVNAPTWHDMSAIEDKGRPAYGSTVIPLYTGDTRLPVIGGYNAHGQVALQQRLPLPMNVLALIPEILPGDTPGVAEPAQQRRQA